jgi:isoleucyl-tRNA synthetase
MCILILKSNFRVIRNELISVNSKNGKDFDLTDRISISLEENCPFRKELTNNEQYICTEVLSDKIEFVISLANFEEIEIDEVKFNVNIEKI